MLDFHGRVITLEANFANHLRNFQTLVEGQESSNEKLDQILDTMAEQRGAAKAVKVIYGLVIAALGFLGGLAGAGARHL